MIEDHKKRMDWFLMKGGKKQKEPQKEPLAKEPAPPPPAAPLGIQGAVLEEPSTGVTLAWQPLRAMAINTVFLPGT